MKVELPRFENLPDRISRLGELAYNLWWSWESQARALFRRLDLTLWRTTNHNPIRMLQEMSSEAFRKAIGQEGFLEHYDSIIERFDQYMTGRSSWFAHTHPEAAQCEIGYFCAEFGLHNSLPIYSGGLGLLAGDTCKEASDLGIPFVAIGYHYPEGYFYQRIESDGRQEATYRYLDPDKAPILPVINTDGSRFVLPVPVAEREVKVSVWKVQAGRVPIYLMDTCIEENDPWDRDVSARLYGGDHSVRLRQEIILGMGGLRVLRALGHSPSVLHLNEGHAAFASLQLLDEFVCRGLDFDQAVNEVRRRVVFTTHTPVKAGHDEFSFQMMEEFFRPYWERLGISRERLLSLGKAPDGDSFVMTVLALRTASRANGVSAKHGEVSREMWQQLWPERLSEEVPIRSITNGVHVPTWVPPEIARLYERYLGADWLDRHDDQRLWERVGEIPDEELWNAHQALKSRLLRLAQERARDRWIGDGVSPGQLVAFGALLDPEVLTIGFARRFATYKRGNLILRDRERLKRILHNPWRPVQIIFSGKAHPADEPGKYVLQEVFQACTSHEMAGRIVFIEEYNKHVAHHLIQGCDVWLNNPLPPLEASGTSGQKASLNGMPNCSVLDGWWGEGYNGRNGWAISPETGLDDEATANAIYELIENQIAPLYYRRGLDGLPRDWLRVMKEAIRSLAAPFSARRMMKEYVESMYLAACRVEETVGEG